MAIVVPTVLATTPDEYAAMLERAEGLSKRVHVDIADGLFVDSTTIQLAQVHTSTETKLDLHLMVQNPAAYLETALSYKPHLIIFHAEAQGDLLDLIEQCRRMGVKAGLGVLPLTTVDSIKDLVGKVDQVLVFAGSLGHNGGEFHPEVLAKMDQIRALEPSVELSVDGGVSDQNAALVVLQGVDVLYVGSFLQQADDPAAAYASISQQAGVSV